MLTISEGLEYLRWCWLGFLPNFLFFSNLKPHAKFRNPTITPSWRKVTAAERKKKREKMPLIVNSFVTAHASNLDQHFLTVSLTLSVSLDVVTFSYTLIKWSLQRHLALPRTTQQQQVCMSRQESTTWTSSARPSTTTSSARTKMSTSSGQC